jgi:hypothetical protein
MRQPGLNSAERRAHYTRNSGKITWKFSGLGSIRRVQHGASHYLIGSKMLIFNPPGKYRFHADGDFWYNPA